MNTPHTIPDRAELPPLPLAFEFVYEFPSPAGGVHRKMSPARWNGSKASESYTVYTAEQMREYALAARSPAGTPQAEPLKAAPDAVVDNKFRRAWLRLEKLPGGMMHGPEGLFGPIPASCSAWVTTSESEREHCLAKGEPMLEVWLASALSTTQQAAKSAAASDLPQANYVLGVWGDASREDRLLNEDAYTADQMRQQFNAGREFESERLAAHSAAPAAVDVSEGVEIIGNLIASIEKHGMYSQESTLGFLTQAYYSLRPENPPLPATQAPAAVGKREAFEAWATSKKWDIARYEDGQYVASYARDGWDAYQAALMPAGAAVGEWHPTPEAINALPQPLRDYIHELETQADPAGAVRELVQLRDTNAGLQKMYRRAAASLAEVIGCFDAAAGEGLAEALAETTDERLKDLVERRLMHAQHAATTGGASTPTGEGS